MITRTVELVRVGTYFLDNGRQIGGGTGGRKEHKQVSPTSQRKYLEKEFNMFRSLL